MHLANVKNPVISVYIIIYQYLFFRLVRVQRYQASSPSSALRGILCCSSWHPAALRGILCCSSWHPWHPAALSGILLLFMASSSPHGGILCSAWWHRLLPLDMVTFNGDIKLKGWLHRVEYSLNTGIMWIGCMHLGRHNR